MKSFKSTAWLLPQPVLIIGTYDKEGKPNAMNAAWGGQWDMHEIMISLGSHQTTDNLAVNPEFTVTFATADTLVASDYVGIASGRNTPDKGATRLTSVLGWAPAESGVDYREGSQCECTCIQGVSYDA